MTNNKIVLFLVSTTLGGLLLLIPMALLGVVVYVAYDVTGQLGTTVGLDLPYSAFVDGLIIGAVALIGVILLCFFIGLLLRTSLGRFLERKYDDLLEKYLPVVGMVRNLVMQVVGSKEEVLRLKPAEVNLHGSESRQYALIVEQLPDDRVVLFVPSVPAATIGQIHIVPMSSVTVLDAPVQDLLNAITQWGAGASIIYRGE